MKRVSKKRDDMMDGMNVKEESNDKLTI